MSDITNNDEGALSEAGGDTAGASADVADETSEVAAPAAAEAEAISDTASAAVDASAPAASAPAAPSVAPKAASASRKAPVVGPETDNARINSRKVREGVVISTAMEKTAVIQVVERVRHPRYGKIVQRTKKLYVHDQESDLRNGDRVRVCETRPLSKLKHWRILEVLERAK